MQYTYDGATDKSENEKELWVKSSNNKNRSYAIEDYEVYVNSPNLEVRNSFHLMFLGLDKINLTVKELYQQIYIKLKTTVGAIDIKNILIVDNESLLCNFFYSGQSLKILSGYLQQ